MTEVPAVCAPVGTGCGSPVEPGVDFWLYPNLTELG